MRIIIDAMGGDNAPAEIVRGAVDAHRELGCGIILVGKQDEVRNCLEECGVSENEDIRVVHAEEVITMHDEPSMAVRRKRNSSLAVALNMLKDGEGDAIVSAGSTGALLSGATLTVKRIKGIRRAAMAPVIPNGGKGVVLIDCGANSECTAEYLLQFAYMGSFYARTMLDIESPKVALLNNGTEDSKGTELQKQAYALLQAAHNGGRINFVGNVEGSGVFSGDVDVVVTDGFTGNILLKTIEGTAKFLMKNIKGVFSGVKGKLAAVLVMGGLKNVKSLLDSSRIGGTAFLGISKPVIKAHGNSNALAIKNAVKQAVSVAESGIIDEIIANMEYMKLDNSAE